MVQEKEERMLRMKSLSRQEEMRYEHKWEDWP